MSRLLLLLVSMALIAFGGATSAGAAPVAGKVLVFGANDNGFEGNNAASTLTSLGMDVDRTTALPNDLSGYASIWFVGAYSGLPSSEVDALADYVAGGGSAYLTGERPCCEAMNGSVRDILRKVLKDQDVQVGGLGDINGPFTFNTDVTDHVARVPNRLTDFVPHSPGGIDGIGKVSDHNVFASNGTIAVGAVWSEADMKAGKGRIAILMDVDWLGDDARVPIIENLENFLTSGSSCSNAPADNGMTWNGGAPANCSTILTPQAAIATISAPPGGGQIEIETVVTGATSDCHVEQSTSTPAGNSSTFACNLSDASPSGGRLKVIATDSRGKSARTFRLLPKNDPRNVPPGETASSNWWSWPDRDDDGIPDFWETNGVWVDDAYWNLSADGADPNRKDLFLHYDFLEGEELREGTFDRMRAMFDESPVSNPAPAKSGVHLHVTRGASVPRSIAGSLTAIEAATSDPAVQRISTYSGFAGQPRAGGPGVPQISKWMFNFDESKVGAGLADINGTTAWTAWPVNTAQAAIKSRIAWPATAEEFAEAVNASHELGHTLGLHHHGATDCKDPSLKADAKGMIRVPPGKHCDMGDPGYRSVMSYAYSHFGLPQGAFSANTLDYSRESAVNLDWTVGKGAGRLTFVPGQWGELPSFYAQSANRADRDQAEVIVEPASEDGFKFASPEAIKTFIADQGIDADPDFPTLAPASATVAAGDSVEVPLAGRDREGAPLTYVIDHVAGGGTAVATASGFVYTSTADETGVAVVTVRATNAHLGSAPIDVSITVIPRDATPPAGSATPPSSSQQSTPPATQPRFKAPASFASITAKRIKRRSRVQVKVIGVADGTRLTVRWEPIKPKSKRAKSKAHVTVKRGKGKAAVPAKPGRYRVKVTSKGVLLLTTEIVVF